MLEGFRPEASWEALYRFRQALDDRLEELQEQGSDLSDLLSDLQRSFTRALAAVGTRVHVFDEDEEDDWILVVGDGLPRSLSAATGRLQKAGWRDLESGFRAYDALFDISNGVLGSATVFVRSGGALSEEWTARYTEAFVEQVDNYVHQVHQARSQHRLGLRIQKCLETPVFEEGLDAAVRVLMAGAPVEGFVLFYSSRHLLYPEAVVYRAYDRTGKVVADGFENRDEAFEASLRDTRLEALGKGHLGGRLKVSPEEPVVLPLVRHGQHVEYVGKLFAWLRAGAPRSAAIAQCEVLQTAVLQRLADYSRETRHLQRYFAPRVVQRLLRTPEYDTRLLAPRVQDLAVVFMDVASFTELSETILVEPDAIGRFIDLWSGETTRVLLQHQGVLDKLIGDCVLGLFGPPFFEAAPAELAAQALTACQEMRQATRDLLDHPELAPFRDRIARWGGLDVSTGVNLCRAAVGSFGSNQDYTVFGSGVNNAARLQSMAGRGRILAMKPVVEALEASPAHAGRFRFGEQGSGKAKNVAEPLVFRELLE